MGARDTKGEGQPADSSVICPDCKAELGHVTPFCPWCGHALPRVPQSATLRGERRSVTVLFADISGFTAMAEKLDPEDLTNVINRCFEALTQPITEQGGTIDKFIGDCVMARFGAPTAHEDDPRRAARAALRMQRALTRLRSSLPHPVSLTVGINSGPVVAGYVGTEGRREYTVMGDVVNVAKRLQEAASPGEILVGDATARLIETVFELQGVPAVRAKGKSEPVIARRLVSEPVGRRSAPLGRFEGAGPLLEPPLVGRDLEWKKLVELLDQAQRAQGHVVLLTGQAGAGKSRLKVALRAEASKRGIDVIQGRATDASAGMPLAPFGDLLLAILEQQGPADAPEHRRRLTELGTQHGLSRTETNRLLRYVGVGPVGVGDGAEGRRLYELFGAFRKVLVPAVGSPTKLVLLEDWQRADAQSRDLLELLAHAVGPHAALFLVMERTESAPTRLSPKITHLPLRRLGDGDALALLAAIVPQETVPPALREEVIRKSEGNPLFLLQILHGWVGAGLLAPDGARYRFTGKTAEPEIPDTLQAVIAARIDRLPADARALLMRAAVLGHSFPRAVVVAMETTMTGDAEETVARRMERLAEESLLRRSSHGDRMSFANTLVCDVAVSTLLRADVREVHLRAAEAYEHAGDLAHAPPPAVLHRHWLGAGDEQRALPYLIAAADQSRTAFDHPRAAAEYGRALAILERHPAAGAAGLAADVLERLGDVQLAAGDYRAAEAAFEQTRADRARLGAVPLTTEARALRRLAMVAQKLGRYHDAIELCDEAILLAREEPILGALLDGLAALTCCYAGRFTLAVERVRRGLARLSAGDSPSSVDPTERAQAQAMLLRAHGNALLGMGRASEAAFEFEAGMRLSEQIGDRLESSIALYNLGSAYARQDDHAKAVLYYNRAIAEKTVIGDTWGLAYTYEGIANLHAGEGNTTRALEDALRGLAIAEGLGDRKLCAMLRAMVGRLRFDLGEADDAEQELGAAVAEAAEVGASPEVIQAELGLSAVLRERGKFTEAIAAAKRALDLANRVGASQARAEALISLGRAYSSGHGAEAQRALKDALQVATDAAHVGHRFIALEALAEFHIAHAEYDQALAFLDDIDLAVDPAQDRAHRGAATLARAEIHFRRGENGTARELAERALDDFRALGSPKRVAQVHVLLARVGLHTTRFADAEAHARTAIELLESQRAPSARELGRAYLTLGYIHYEAVRPAPMQEAFERGLELLRKCGDAAELAAAYRAMSVVYTREAPERTLSLLEQSRSLARDTGSPLAEAEALGDRGEVYRRMGRLPEALEAFRKEEQLVWAIGYERGKAINGFHLASIHYLLGDLPRALDAVDQNVITSQKVGNIGLLYGLEFRGLLRTELGEYEEARVDLDQALELGERLRHAERLANIHRTRAEHFLAYGQLREAASEVANGLRWAEGLGDGSLKEHGFLVKERLGVMAARLALANRAWDRAIETVHEPLETFERLQIPVLQVEAALVLAEARARRTGARTTGGSSFTVLAGTATELGLKVIACDALHLAAVLDCDVAAVASGYTLARTIGAPVRLARFAALWAHRLDAAGDRMGADQERKTAQTIVEKLVERLPEDARSAARRVFAGLLV